MNALIFAAQSLAVLVGVVLLGVAALGGADA